MNDPPERNSQEIKELHQEMKILLNQFLKSAKSLPSPQKESNE